LHASGTEISKRSTTAEFFPDWNLPWQVETGSVLVHRRCRLGAAIPVSHVEIEGGDRMLAENALERDAAIRLLGCVISHGFVYQIRLYSFSWLRPGAEGAGLSGRKSHSQNVSEFGLDRQARRGTQLAPLTR
jgi:hypothetical protein